MVTTLCRAVEIYGARALDQAAKYRTHKNREGGPTTAVSTNFTDDGKRCGCSIPSLVQTDLEDERNLRDSSFPQYLLYSLEVITSNRILSTIRTDTGTAQSREIVVPVSRYLIYRRSGFVVPVFIALLRVCAQCLPEHHSRHLPFYMDLRMSYYGVEERNNAGSNHKPGGIMLQANSVASP